MRIFLLTICIIVSGTAISVAQAPQKINYQGIARNVTGQPIPNQNLGIRISIHDLTPTGSVVYQETQSPQTNGYGLYNLAIGTGIPIIGNLADVNWSSGNKFIQIELDPSGGNNYSDIGTSQLLSVPYSLYSEKANPTLLYTLDGF
ncbi:MAG: hypothetical protein BGO69_10450 [Bacteroidetes bacterium 46-16]|nr:MAG: hypothetical protein BGO69_10450 [Bacteroidetes bacterium 46-16]